MSIARWNLKEAGGKVLVRGTRTALGAKHVDKTAKQVKVQKLHGHATVDAAGIWNESEASYRGRSHGRVETEYEARLKQDLS